MSFFSGADQFALLGDDDAMGALFDRVARCGDMPSMNYVAPPGARTALADEVRARIVGAIDAYGTSVAAELTAATFAKVSAENAAVVLFRHEVLVVADRLAASEGALLTGDEAASLSMDLHECWTEFLRSADHLRVDILRKASQSRKNRKNASQPRAKLATADEVAVPMRDLIAAAAAAAGPGANSREAWGHLFGVLDERHFEPSEDGEDAYYCRATDTRIEFDNFKAALNEMKRQTGTSGKRGRPRKDR